MARTKQQASQRTGSSSQAASRPLDATAGEGASTTVEDGGTAGAENMAKQEEAEDEQPVL